jgi:hypothetical protein
MPTTRLSVAKIKSQRSPREANESNLDNLDAPNVGHKFERLPVDPTKLTKQTHAVQQTPLKLHLGTKTEHLVAAFVKYIFTPPRSIRQHKYRLQ